MTATSLACLMNQLETLWGYYDSVLATLTPTDWQQPFGSEWTVADVPRHLIYFDRQVLAEPIAAGPNVPAERQVLMRTHREFNLWNSQSLAVQRRQTGLPHLLSELQAARAAVRAAVAPLTEADLDRPVWIALTGVGGWRTVRFALEIGRQHAWMHLMQLRLRLGLSVPAVCPEITHDALNGILWALVNLPKRRWAGPRRLTVAMEIVGPGGGTWGLRVEDGQCTLAEGRPDTQPDLMLKQSTETLVRLLSRMRHPLSAVLTGDLRVRGWRHLHSFFQLFARPHVDQPIPVIQGAPK